MVIIQYLFGAAQILFHAGFHAPRDRQHPVQIVAHNCGFGTHRRHVLELFQLRIRLFTCFLAQLGLGDLGFQLGNFVFAVLTIAQFGLDRLHLFVQIIFALRLLHLGFHARLDLFLDLQNRQFALHQTIDLFQPFADRQGFQQVLLLLDFDAQMTGNQIGQLGRFGSLIHSGQSLFGDVLFDLGIPLELFGDRTQQRFGCGHIAGHLGQILGTRLKKAIVFKVFCDAHACLPLDQHLDGAIGQFQQLQHIGQHARLENTVGFGVVNRRVNLTGQQDLLVVGHHLFEGAYGFVTTHKQRHDHMWKDHNIAQRQHRVRGVKWLLHAFISLSLARQKGPDLRQPVSVSFFVSGLRLICVFTAPVSRATVTCHGVRCNGIRWIVTINLALLVGSARCCTAKCG